MEGAVLISLWLGLAAGVGFLANSRGRSGIGWFLFAVLLSPLIGLIIVLIMSNLVEEEAKERRRQQDHERQLESIRSLATVAKAAPAPAPTQPAAAKPTEVSVADELRKLGDLVAQGLLTQDEFQAQKARLLAGGAADR